MTLRFDPAAQDELIESALYYEAARAGLGVAFRDAVRMVLDRLLEHVAHHRRRSGYWRRRA